MRKKHIILACTALTLSVLSLGNANATNPAANRPTSLA